MSEAETGLQRVGLDKWGKLPRPLAPLEGRKPEAPAWFDEAMALPVIEHRIAVDGAEIEALSWGDPKAPPVLLLHGSMAHARWWNPVAPLLSKDHHVIAMSFAGMGGSQWRDKYSTTQMAREAMGVAEALSMFDGPAKPVLISHSFGGKAASIVAGDHGEKFAGTVFVDSFILPGLEIGGNPPPYRHREYETIADAITRFRLSPDQPSGELYILDAIARGGIVERHGSWTWCFDPDFFHKIEFENTWDEARRSLCPLAFIRGEHSPIATRADFALQRANMRSDSIFIEIPEAYHHIMVDQPLALTATLRAIIAFWSLPDAK